MRREGIFAVGLLAAAGCAAGCGGAAAATNAEMTGEATEVVVDHRVEWPLALEGVTVTLDDRSVQATGDELAEAMPAVVTAAPLDRGDHRVRVKLTVSRPCIPGGPRERLTVRASRTVRLEGPSPIGIVLRGNDDTGVDVRIGTGVPGDQGQGTVVATTTDGCGLLPDGA